MTPLTPEQRERQDCKHLGHLFGHDGLCLFCQIQKPDFDPDVAPYLKDGETPADCIARNRNDVDIVLGLLTKEKQHTRDLEADAVKAEQTRQGLVLALVQTRQRAEAYEAERDAAQKAMSYASEQAHLEWTRASKLEAENERLRRGDFTKDEIHAICHNLHGTVDAEAFADGCAAEQVKLYGRSPDRQRAEAAEAQLEQYKHDFYRESTGRKQAEAELATHGEEVARLRAALQGMVDSCICCVDEYGKPEEWLINAKAALTPPPSTTEQETK